MTTIGETVSRVRNVVKGVKQDAFLTDRFLYSLILKYARMYIKQQDDTMRLARMDSMFTSLCLDLIEVDKVECGCGSIESDCFFMRSKNKIPQIMEGSFGPIIRAVSSVDISHELFKTYPTIYTAMSKSSNFKYNKRKFYWILNGYIYIPDVSWEAVRLEAIWDDDISYLTCNTKECVTRQQQQSNIPDFLFAMVEQQVLNELGMTMKIPGETTQNNQDILRT
jgi:hypothetical protein